MEEPTDAQTKRQQKVERFRKEKAAKARLADLQGALLRSRRMQELDSDNDDSSSDDEAQREAWLTRLELAVLRAAEQTGLLKQVTLGRRCPCGQAFHRDVV